MNYSYKKMYNKNFLIVDEFKEPLTKDYRIEMLKRNTVEGLMEMQIFTEDNIPSFHYDITGKFSFHSYYFENRIKHNDIMNFFTSLQNTLLNLHKYLLDYDHLVLTPQCVFFDKNHDNFYFTYCPCYKSDFFESLKEFLSYILTIADHDDQQTVLTAYALFKETENEGFNLQSLMDIINKQIIPSAPTPIKEPAQEQPKNNILKEPDILLKENYSYDTSFLIKNVSILGCIFILLIGNIILKLAGFYSVELFFIILMVLVIFSIFYASSVIREAPMHRNYQKDVVHEPDNVIQIDISNAYVAETFDSPAIQSDCNEETVLLCINPTINARHLIYTGIDYSQEATIDNYPFSIGKAEDNSLIINHPAVSRHHCRITCINDNYYIEDLNSSNSTKINDLILPAYTPTVLSIGDTITFAHLTYIFQ